MSQFHELQVSSINRETPEAVSVGFQVPDALKTEFDFVAGQYLTLEKEIAGTKFRRSYSICSSPVSGELKVAVKQIADGRFSSWVNSKLKIGDTLNVFLPEGRFTHEPSPARNGATYVGFAAGSGITPVIAILQSVLYAEPDSKFILVYGNKTPKDVIFYNQLLSLQKEHPNRLFIELVYSRLQEEGSALGKLKRSFFGKKKEKPTDSQVLPTHRGHINGDLVKHILEDKYADEKAVDFYLCGPQAMIENVSEALKARGIEENHVHYELFISEEPKEVVKAQAANTGKTKITVILDEEETTFEMERSQRVLDAAMDEGLDPPYSCQGGICSSCLAQIVEGEVEMVNNQILTDKEVEEGLVLTCQAHPKTDRLIVDYDDV